MPPERKKAKRRGKSATAQFERALEEAGKERYMLRLYVSGMTPRSRDAIEEVRRLCEAHLAGRYELDVIDIFTDPNAAREGQVVAAPTLVKRLPPPLRRFVGDMSKSERLLQGLDIRVVEK